MIAIPDVVVVAVVVTVIVLFTRFRKELWLSWECAECGSQFLTKPTFFTRQRRQTLAERWRERYRNPDGELCCANCMEAYRE